MKTDYDAIVVGGGPAGSTVAIRLAEASWSVALVEQKEFPRRKVCGECIAATNLDLLDALGIGAAFSIEAGPPLRRVALMQGDRVIRAALPKLAETNHPFGRALGREHLDSLLLRRAVDLGVEVRQPWTVRRVGRLDSFGRRSVDISNRSGGVATLGARTVIAAQGSWSSDPFVELRRVHRPQASDLLAFKGTYVGSSLEPGLLPVLAFKGGYGGMVIGDGRQLTFAFCIRRDVLKQSRRHRPDMSVAMAAQEYVLSQCRGARDVLSGAELSGPWLATGPIRPGVRSPFSTDGIFAVGNAAGEAHPILGEGISMAIQGAWLLSELLIRYRPEHLADQMLEDIGRQYDSRWRQRFTARIRVAALFAHLAMRQPTAAVLSGVVSLWPMLLTTSARWGAKVRRTVILVGQPD